MAQSERTTSGMIGPDSATIQATINTLKDAMVIGATVQAAHINSLLSMWRQFNDHYHSVSDLYGIDNYGNVGRYGTAWDSPNPKNTDAMGGTEPADVTSGDTILASKHEEIKNALLGANDHAHNIYDRDG
jgi:hypothetical protein